MSRIEDPDGILFLHACMQKTSIIGPKTLIFHVYTLWDELFE